MANKTDLIVTKHWVGNLVYQHEWIAYIPGKEVLAQKGKTEAEAIGNLWLASAGDLIATFVEGAATDTIDDGD
jgi:hypothetical protein